MDFENLSAHTHRQAHTLVFNLPITDEFLGDEAEYFWLLLDFILFYFILFLNFYLFI